jgi:calcineurin-like phosphoesterase family protein
MSEILYTSDLHCYHRHIQEFCPFSRKGDSPEQMTDMILENISSRTRPGDILYNLGDVCFQTLGHTLIVLNKIKSMGIEHHLILGNHDERIRNNPECWPLLTSIQDMKFITVGKKQISMCHFPLAKWNNQHNGAWSLHGHSHGGYVCAGKQFDVGIDTRTSGDMMPYSHHEIKKIMDMQEITPHHDV